MKRDTIDMCLIGPDPQCDLLGHGATRHEHRCLRAEKAGDTPLETLDHIAGPVVVLIEIGIDEFDEIGERVAHCLSGVVAEPSGRSVWLLARWHTGDARRRPDCRPRCPWRFGFVDYRSIIVGWWPVASRNRRRLLAEIAVVIVLSSG